MATRNSAKRMDYDLKVVMQFKGKPYVGQVDYKKKLITVALRGGISGRVLTSVEVLQAYYHEIVHAVLHDMKHPLNADEKFVDAFAQRLRWYAKGTWEEMMKDKKKMPLTWSHSALKDYENCARKYHEVRILKRHKQSSTEQIRYGEELHKAAEEYVTGTPLPPQFAFIQPTLDALLEKKGTKHAEVKM